MKYKALVRHADYFVWEEENTGKLLFTGILGEHAMAPRTFAMNEEEISKFRTLGNKYLSELKIRLEAEHDNEPWNSRFIKDFDKQPEIEAVIYDRSYETKKQGFLAKLFS